MSVLTLDASSTCRFSWCHPSMTLHEKSCDNFVPEMMRTITVAAFSQVCADSHCGAMSARHTRVSELHGYAWLLGSCRIIDQLSCVCFTQRNSQEPVHNKHTWSCLDSIRPTPMAFFIIIIVFHHCVYYLSWHIRNPSIYMRGAININGINRVTRAHGIIHACKIIWKEVKKSKILYSYVVFVRITN